MKKYSITEVLNHKVGTLFDVVTPDGYKYKCEVCGDTDVRYIKNAEKDKEIEINSYVANSKFYKVKTLVYFQEALDSGKRIRLSGVTFKHIVTGSGYLTDCIKAYEKGEYLVISDLLGIMSIAYNDIDFREALNSKMWLIEEENTNER